jgi:hypothetical protein
MHIHTHTHTLSLSLSLSLSVCVPFSLTRGRVDPISKKFESTRERIWLVCDHLGSKRQERERDIRENAPLSLFLSMPLSCPARYGLIVCLRTVAA